MSKTRLVRQLIEFEGYFAEGVLGIFKIIRGFADLRDLAAVSVLPINPMDLLMR